MQLKKCSKRKSSIKKAVSILERAYYRHMEESSFFLDPFEQEVIESIANKNDIIVLTGKGHETYQEINGKKIPFDERKIIKKYV